MPIENEAYLMALFVLYCVFFVSIDKCDYVQEFEIFI